MVPGAEIPSDEELIRLAKQGDQPAFGLLVERYQDQVVTLACRTLGHQDRARDVAQEAFIRSWRAIGDFRGQCKFSSWLYRITLNSCFSELRRQKRLPDSLSPDEPEFMKIADSLGRNFADDLEREDLVEKLIKQLPPIFRSIVILHYLQGLDCQEISELTDRPVGTVKAYLHRARAHLRENVHQLLRTRDETS